MKISANWCARQNLRLSLIKVWQRRKVASELSIEQRAKSVSRLRIKHQQWACLQSAKHMLCRRGTRADYEHSGTFQQAIAPVLVLAQVFALMPVKGVTATTADALSFSWLHIRTLYSLLVIACMGACAAFTIAFALRTSLNFDTVETIIFFTSIFFIASAFFNLARKWPGLLVQWEAVERRLPLMRTQREKAQLAYSIKIITLVATMCSLMEHLLSMLSIVYYVNRCPAMAGRPIDSFLYSNFTQFFYFVEYTTLAGVLGKVLNVMSTFAWNFNDIFVMAVSVSLRTRFRQLNEHMRVAAKRPTTEQFWIRSRVNYRELCKLCEAADDALSIITLLCFSNNLYFVCSKILKSLQKKPSFTHTLYFWFSLVYLLGRTFVLSIYAAEINAESKRPLAIFRGITRKYWCPELQRFSEEVTADVVALSGLKLFHLTRRLVMSVAGTIVTYELVLLQLNKEDKINDCFES